jgi:hypothetical protein
MMPFCYINLQIWEDKWKPRLRLQEYNMLPNLRQLFNGQIRNHFSYAYLTRHVTPNYLSE